MFLLEQLVKMLALIYIYGSSWLHSIYKCEVETIHSNRIVREGFKGRSEINQNLTSHNIMFHHILARLFQISSISIQGLGFSLT